MGENEVTGGLDANNLKVLDRYLTEFMPTFLNAEYEIEREVRAQLFDEKQNMKFMTLIENQVETALAQKQNQNQFIQSMEQNPAIQLHM